MKIAVCDDEPKDLLAVVQLLQQYDGLSIEQFSSTSNLLEAFSHTRYDIVLLDIEMPAPNGFETATLLRAGANPPLIIFLTKSTRYVYLGYGIAFRYLVKPVSHSAFEKAMDDAIAEVHSNNLLFTCGSGLLSLPIRDIVFVESYGHDVIIHTLDNEYHLNGPLKAVQTNLPKQRFSSPHKSYLVNLQYVRSFSPSTVTLANGIKVPVSRRHKAEFESALCAYLGR